MNWKRFAFVAATAGLLASAAPDARAATLITSGGELIGASGVIVGTGSYEVSFIDGSCASIFSGCDSAADFAFTTFETAGQAAQALLDQVFIGVYDTEPERIAGCGSVVVCAPDIPYSTDGTTFDLRRAFNYAIEANDAVGQTEGILVTTNYGFFGGSTFARFTPTSAIPEPGAWMMMLAGFGALGASLRSRRRHAALA